MNLESFVEKLDLLSNMITDGIMNNKNGINDYRKIIIQLQDIIPDLFSFIEQTEIGDMQDIMSILGDINQGLENNDKILIVDAFYNGLKSIIDLYSNTIKEVLYE